MLPFCNTSFLKVNSILNKTQEFFSKYELDTNKQIILFAPPGLKDFVSSKMNYNFEILQKLVKIFSSRNDCTLIIKPHPADLISDYQKILKNSPNCKIIDGNLLELISISSFLISTFSTTMIDAMTMKIPVMQIIFDNISYKRPYDNYDVVLKSSIKNMPELIEKLLLDKTLQANLIQNGSKFVKDYYNLPIENPEKIIQNIISDLKNTFN